MQIKAIELADDPDADNDAKPTHITCRMSLREAVFLSSLLGNLSDFQIHVHTDDVRDSHNIWNALQNDVFNRYWDEGYDGPDSSMNYLARRAKKWLQDNGKTTEWREACSEAVRETFVPK